MLKILCFCFFTLPDSSSYCGCDSSITPLINKFSGDLCISPSEFTNKIYQINVMDDFITREWYLKSDKPDKVYLNRELVFKAY